MELLGSVDISADDLAAVAACEPGRTAVSFLLDVPLSELSASGRVDALVAYDKVIRWAEARKARVLARMWAGQQGPSADKEWAREDVSAALRVGPNTAMVLLHTADELVTRLPDTLALLEDGEISTFQARVIAEATLPLDREAAAQVQRRALARADLYAGQFRTAVAKAVIAADPEGAERRRRQARAGRRVTVRPLPDGMGSVYAELAAEQALTVYGCIDARAKTYTDNCRTADQKRADALVELITAPTGDATAPPVPSSGPPSGPAAGPEVQVTVALSTLLRLDEQPGELDRIGPVTAEVARFLAGQESATWRALLVDEAGRLLDVGRSSYRPPAALRRYIQARDRHCRFPGCGRRADLCEIDHLERWQDGGPTSADNLHALSGRHHHAKDDHGWRPRRHPDGTTDWRSPTGHHYQVPAATYPVDHTATSPADPDPPPYRPGSA